MLKLNINQPNSTALRHLAKQQAIIDKLIIDQKVYRAQTLWDAKRNSKSGAEAFREVTQTLIGMCISTKLCNYCEHNEADDVEHIYPKSFFPERTFLWPNYLLACKSCNTGYKADKFAVFTPSQSNTAVHLQRKRNPPSTDAAFIDPRVEDPMRYLMLDIIGSSFFLEIHPDLTDPRDIAKAHHTLEILQIGKRAALNSARKAAFKFYQDRLDRYKMVRDATDWKNLEDLVQDPDLVDRTNGFEVEQESMMNAIKQSILDHLHPTVWHEMQRQHQALNRVKKLFEDVPEALTWSVICSS